MGMLKGIPVKLIHLVETGVDPLGNPTYSESYAMVDNVLVAPTTCRLNAVSASITERIIETEIAIPKGDSNVWENSFVEFFGKRWQTVGTCTEGIEAMIPLDWHRKIKVERHES